MSTTTSNLNLIKPELTDNVDVGVMNSNFETIDEAVSELKVDYVVATGSQNGWTYRRWASGLMDCYGRFAVSFTTNIKWYSIYRTEIGLYNKTYPVSFVDVPVLVRSFDSAKGTSWALASSGASKTNTGGTMFANPSPNVSESGYLSFFAQGRWK